MPTYLCKPWYTKFNLQKNTCHLFKGFKGCCTSAKKRRGVRGDICEGFALSLFRLPPLYSTFLTQVCHPSLYRHYKSLDFVVKNLANFISMTEEGDGKLGLLENSHIA